MPSTRAMPTCCDEATVMRMSGPGATSQSDFFK
jgi:hypothetical protein